MLDRLEITVCGGNGGDGCVSFRHSKSQYKGGPDGGDGGEGGNVLIQGAISSNTLSSVRKKSLVGGRGGHGSSNLRTGAQGKDIVITVPDGTVVRALSKEGILSVVGDVSAEDRIIVAKGGHGGIGNARRSSSDNRTPLIAEKGQEGKGKSLILELKLRADIGIVGPPNSGKTSLLTRMTDALPEVAEYPFSTKEVNIGTMERKASAYIVVDTPPIVAGSSKGRGMGLEFLRHVERARILLILLDGAIQNVAQQYEDTMSELRAYPAKLTSNKIVIINKSDGYDAEAQETQKDLITKVVREPLRQISVKTMEGIEPLIAELESILVNTVPTRLARQVTQVTAAPKMIEAKIRKNGRVFILDDEGAQRIVELSDTSDWRVRVQVRRELIRKGLVKLLEEAGIQAGDTLRIGGVEMEW